MKEGRAYASPTLADGVVDEHCYWDNAEHAPGEQQIGHILGARKLAVVQGCHEAGTPAPTQPTAVCNASSALKTMHQVQAPLAGLGSPAHRPRIHSDGVDRVKFAPMHGTA